MEETQLQQIAQQLRKPEGEDGVKTGYMMNQGNCIINEQALLKLDAAPGDAILELGMGNGYFIKDIVGKDSSIGYAGLDYSDTMIAEATALNKEWIDKGQVQLQQGSVAKMPFADAQFSKAMGVNIIYFWETPAVELAEIWRVLKPGGKLVVGIRPKHAMQAMPFTKYGFTMYSKEELTQLLEANSFTVTDVLELKEPAFEMGGHNVVPETLVVTAVKK